MGMKKKEINYQLLIRRICLIVLDIICIIAASILALLTRFEFDFSQIPKEFLKVIYKYGPFTIVITLIIFSLFRIYSSLWEYAGIEEVFSLIAACLAAAVAKIVIILFTWSVMPRSWYVLDTIYLMILIGATRVSYRLIRLRRQNRTFPWSKRKKVMIIGGGEAGRSLITEIQNSKYLDQKVVCIIDDDPYKIGRYIKGVKVVGNRNSIKKSVKKYNVQQIILTIPSANAAKIRPIVEICQDTNCEFMILPGVYQLVNGEVKASKLRPVNIDDLLGRDEVHVNLNEVMDYVSGRVIMVTGGGGSIGSELCRQIAKHSPKQLIIFDIYENNAYDIQQELLREQPKLDLVVLIGSVRDENRINSIFEQYRPEIIYHAAAHKHVPLMEGSPNEAIKNNVLGTYNMVRMADKWNAKRFVQISTDKAVNPTNIMGACGDEKVARIATFADCFDMDVDISNVTKRDMGEFAMALMEYIPCDNWTGFFDAGYAIEFDAAATGAIKKVQLEIKNDTGVKIIDEENDVSNGGGHFKYRFRDKVRNGEALEKISEVCFTVFFAESYIDGEKGRLSIRNLKVTPAYE